uniref:ZFP36 ring finger protein like 2 n=1 Tax=Phasianus colchicus TaxID=9054 RepID=A0A669NZ84_PHACC
MGRGGGGDTGARRGAKPNGRPRNAPTPGPVLANALRQRALPADVGALQPGTAAGEHRALNRASRTQSSPPARRCPSVTGRPPVRGGGGGGGGGRCELPGAQQRSPAAAPRAALCPAAVTWHGFIFGGAGGGGPFPRGAGPGPPWPPPGRSVRGGAGAGAGRGGAGPAPRAAAAAFIWRRRGAPRSSRRSLAAVQPPSPPRPGTRRPARPAGKEPGPFRLRSTRPPPVSSWLFQTLRGERDRSVLPVFPTITGSRDVYDAVICLLRHRLLVQDGEVADQPQQHAGQEGRGHPGRLLRLQLRAGLPAAALDQQPAGPGRRRQVPQPRRLQLVLLLLVLVLLLVRRPEGAGLRRRGRRRRQPHGPAEQGEQVPGPLLQRERRAQPAPDAAAPAAAGGGRQGWRLGGRRGAHQLHALQDGAVPPLRGERRLQVRREVPVRPRLPRAAQPHPPPQVQDRALPHLPHHRLLPLRPALPLHPQRRRAPPGSTGDLRAFAPREHPLGGGFGHPRGGGGERPKLHHSLSFSGFSAHHHHQHHPPHPHGAAPPPPPGGRLEAALLESPGGSRTPPPPASASYCEELLSPPCANNAFAFSGQELGSLIAPLALHTPGFAAAAAVAAAAYYRCQQQQPPPPPGGCPPPPASPPFSFQPLRRLSESPVFDAPPSPPDSLSDRESYLSGSLSSGSLSGSESPGLDSGRRLPIFSRLSISDD